MTKSDNNKKYIRGNQDIDTSLLSLEMMWLGINSPRIKKQVGVLAPDSFLEVIDGRTINYFAEKNSSKLFFGLSSEYVMTDQKLLNKLKKRTILNTDLMLDYSKSILSKIGKLDDKEILESVKRIRSLEAESGLYGIVLAFSDFYGEITNKMLKIVQKRKDLKHQIHLYTNVLSTPTEPSLTVQAYEDIRNGKKSDAKLLGEYFWLDQGYIGQGLTKNDLVKIRASKPKKEIVSTFELEQELSLDEEEKRVFEIARDVVRSKALRADMRQTAYTVLNMIVERLSQRWDVPVKYVKALYSKELVDILAGKKVFPKNIKERFGHSVYIPKGNGDYKIITGEEATVFVSSHFAQENIKNNTEIKGMVAYHGKVRGKVKLVFGPQHNVRVGKGDILVSVATSPQLLPAMIKAEAFITDVGGITSHAAIVARELKKPCIVGTKYASQVLKDGDLIEVDANKGIVRKLNF